MIYGDIRSGIVYHSNLWVRIILVFFTATIRKGSKWETNKITVSLKLKNVYYPVPFDGIKPFPLVDRDRGGLDTCLSDSNISVAGLLLLPLPRRGESDYHLYRKTNSFWFRLFSISLPLLYITISLTVFTVSVGEIRTNCVCNAIKTITFHHVTTRFLLVSTLVLTEGEGQL